VEEGRWGLRELGGTMLGIHRKDGLDSWNRCQGILEETLGGLEKNA
jgi:hypothetical protein